MQIQTTKFPAYSLAMNSPVNLLLLPLFFIQTTLSSSSPNVLLFNTWSKQHQKLYSFEEEKLLRFKTFEDNLAFITYHNSLKNSAYSLSLNDFADLTHQEFVTSWLGLRATALHHFQSPRRPSFRDSRFVDYIPSSVDWRKNGAVTPVKNQASCGASWAFSATGAIEGINKIATGFLLSLSEQELIDCDKSYNGGCSGGNMESAFRWATERGGIGKTDEYPHLAGESACNEHKVQRKVVTIDGYSGVLPNDEEQLLQAVASQPVSAGICASERAFQFYSKGIFSGPCPKSVDHGILIVGYDSENGSDYWIVKNSWGTNWGMDGYIHIQRNSGKQEGVCGINTLASYPIKTNPKPKPKPLLLPSLNRASCDFLRYCVAPEKCCCSSRFIICWSWICCRDPNGVCCDGMRARCPPGDVCDLDGGCHQDPWNSTATTELVDSSLWKYGG